MPFVAGSLEDVEAWAEHDFPVLFAAVTTFVLTDLFGTYDFDGEYLDGKVILQRILISALQVGTTTAGHTVYARIMGNNDVELFRGHEVVSPKDAKQLIWYIKPVADLDDVTLHKPFCYPIKTEHPASIDRLETIIRYFFLRNDETSAVAPKLGFFKAHFRAACRDVARGTGAVTEGDEMDGDDTLPGQNQVCQKIVVTCVTTPLQMDHLPVLSRTRTSVNSATTRPQPPSSTSMFTPWTRAIMTSR